MLMKLMDVNDPIVMIAALQTLSKVIRSPQMKASWAKFLELILLRIIDSYKAAKEVSVNSKLSLRIFLINQF